MDEAFVVANAVHIFASDSRIANRGASPALDRQLQPFRGKLLFGVAGGLLQRLGDLVLRGDSAR